MNKMVQRILMKRCLANATNNSATTAASALAARSISLSFTSSSSSKSSITNTVGSSSRNVYTYSISTNDDSNTTITTQANYFVSQQRYKTFQTTPKLYNDTTESETTTESKGEDDDTIPPFQNPIHHNDPNNEKVLFEDFSDDEKPPIVPLPPFDDGSGNTVADPQLHALAEEMLHLNMIEMKELVDRITDHFGIEENEDDFMPGAEDGGSADGGAEQAVEEKTAFDLKLSGFDAKAKIKVIKEVRAITGLGLKEAKEMVEGAPKTIKKDIKMEEAEELKAKLEAVGATVEIE